MQRFGYKTGHEFLEIIQQSTIQLVKYQKISRFKMAILAALLVAGLAVSTLAQTTAYVCPNVQEVCNKPKPPPGMRMGLGGLLQGIYNALHPQDARDKTCSYEKAMEAYNMCITRNGYLRLYNDLETDSADCWFCKNLIQHNPYETDGVDGLKNWARQYNKNITKGLVDIKRMTGDGDLVWTHVKFPVAKQSPQEEQKFYAAMDIFRIEGDCIAEHWDVLQKMTPPSLSANPHPHF